jgi:pilus assembly protein CpaE
MQTAGTAAAGGAAAGTLTEVFTAFLADANTERVVRQCVIDLGLSLASVHHGSIDHAISQLGRGRSPRAIMVDVSGSDQPVAKIYELAEVCEPGTAVLVIGDRNDVALYRNLLNTGVSDYLVKPASRSLLQSSIATLLGLSEPSNGKDPAQVVAVAGTRGGVGGSTLAANLALALAQHRGVRVALVDLDLFHGSCDLLLGVAANTGLADALTQPERIDELLLQRAAIACQGGVSLFASHGKPDLAAKIDPQALSLLLGHLRRQFDFVLVDACNADAPLLQTGIDQAQVRVLVIDQTMLALRDLLDQADVFETRYEGQRNFIVVNRFGELGKDGLAIADIEKTLERSVDAIIPFDAKSVVAAANAGMPVVTTRSPVGKAIAAIAGELLGEQAARSTAAKPWWKFFGR